VTSAHELITQAAAILLDFDGPVTPLMPAPTNLQVADAARQPLVIAGITLPSEIAQTSDHLAVLRYVWNHHRDQLHDVEAAALTEEINAAQRCLPTTGAHEFLATCLQHGTPVAIVTNNSASAVITYLRHHGIGETVQAVVGRDPLRPDLMKPHPHSLRVASAALGVSPADTVMVGDSLSDVAAARSVSAKVVGYGKNSRRAAELRKAGADVVIDTMAILVPSLH
jgi:HAD superfamily hydrolase (TIGR01509 family)